MSLCDSDLTNQTIDVLVVDDDPAFLDLTADTLDRKRESLVVETETDPESALDRIDDGVDCIVSDYEMPGMDGIEFLRAVREDFPDLPFVLFTGKGSEAIASEAISAGVTDYLQKNGGTDQYDLLAQQITNAVRKYRAERRVDRSAQAIETATAGIAFLDCDREFVYANEAFGDVFGYSPEELIGSRLERIYRDEDLEYLHDTLLPKAEDSGWTGRTVQRRRDGTTVVTDQSLSYAEDGTLVCTVRAVTERERALPEFSLKERAMDAAPIGISIADASRPDNPVIYVNEGFEDLTGYDREDVLGENLRLLQGPRTAAEPVAAMRDAIDAEEPVTVELRNHREDGTTFWNRVSVAPVHDDDGDVTHYVGFQEDVTERKQAEREAEALLKQFENFGSVLAHDLRKPVSKARGRIELARRTGDWAELENAEENLRRLDSLIGEFADMMRTGRIVTEPTEVDIGEVAGSVWASVMPDSATLRVDKGPPVTADRDALRRLFENLFRNARNHGGGDVRVRLEVTADGFAVADDGPGIPEGQREEVFAPGFTTREAGTGLGLASVRGIVLAHGWKVAVTESRWGGARFEVATRPDAARPRSVADGVEA